jgi:transposase-like protein
MTRLAADYSIDLRDGGPVATHPVDRDWLYREYVTGGRSLPELAREQGVSATTMARWAKSYGIPMRPRGGMRRTADANVG